MKKQVFALAYFFLLPFKLPAYYITIDSDLILEPDGNNGLQIASSIKTTPNTHQEVCHFADHIGSQTVSIIPTQHSNQFVMVLPEDILIGEEQIHGVLVTAYDSTNSPISFHTPETITHLNENLIIPTGNNHLPTFSPLNAISQPMILAMVNQLYEGINPTPTQVHIPAEINIGSPTAPVNGFVVQAAIDNDIIHVTLNQSPAPEAVNQPYVILSTLSSTAIEIIKEEHQITCANLCVWLMHKIGKWLLTGNQSTRYYGSHDQNAKSDIGKYGKQSAMVMTILLISTLKHASILEP